MAQKSKVSLTLDREILEALDQEAEARGTANRSEMVETILRSWVRVNKKAKLDQAIADYYRGMSSAEAAEDARWAELGLETVSRQWDIS